MTTDDILQHLNQEKRNIERLETFILEHKETLDRLALPVTGYCGGIDFDNLPHDKIVQVIQAFPGTWSKEPNGPMSDRIDYQTVFSGTRLRCWAGEPPPNCKIVEELVNVPAQPATTKVVRKLVCSQSALPNGSEEP